MTLLSLFRVFATIQKALWKARRVVTDSPLCSGCRLPLNRLQRSSHSGTPPSGSPTREDYVIASVLDYIHELRIDAARKRFVRYPTQENHNKFKSLLLSRSPRKVTKMERDMGIL